VHGEHERGGEGGEKPVGPAVVAPLGVRALPAQRHHRVDLLLEAVALSRRAAMSGTRPTMKKTTLMVR